MEQKKTIECPKTIYLVKTFSRTKRKDYENYVINAIWQRLGDDTIEPVTQQYVHNPGAPKEVDGKKYKHYFIDLYFPALNIGIECDEAHHLDEGNQKSDIIREANIYDALHEIEAGLIYKTIRIDVSKTYDAVEKQINDAVRKIKQRIEELRKKDKLPEWRIQTPEQYFANKTKITIHDNIGFQSISQVCNILFSTNYHEEASGRRKTYFTPGKFISKSLEEKFRKSEIADCKLWFPRIAIEDEQGNLISATKSGWNNQLINDGTAMIEKNEKTDYEKKPDNKKRITFAYYRDPLGFSGYKFVGIFVLDRRDDTENKRYYHRESDECILVK